MSASPLPLCVVHGITLRAGVGFWEVSRRGSTAHLQTRSLRFQRKRIVCTAFFILKMPESAPM